MWIVMPEPGHGQRMTDLLFGKDHFPRKKRYKEEAEKLQEDLRRQGIRSTIKEEKKN